MTEGSMTALRRDDADARAQAQTVFDRPLVIEAGAGTGKTQTLVSRIVAWSIGPGWQRAAQQCAATATRAAIAVAPDAIAARVLHGVVAITFTEAAAAEMSARLAEVLAAIERGQRPAGVLDPVLDQAGDALRHRARALLGALDHVVVRTIHAYCRRLLGRYPLEAGVHPNLTVDAEGTLQREVVRNVVEAATRRGYSDASDHLLLDLAEHGVGPLQIEEAINLLIGDGVAPAALAADPYTRERIDQGVADLRDALEALETAAGDRLDAPGNRSLSGKIGAALAESRRYLRSTPITALEQVEACAACLNETWPTSLVARLREWGRNDIGAREREAFGGRAAAIGEAAGRLGLLLGQWRDLNPALLDLARRALSPLLTDVYTQLRGRGIATYAALLHGVQTMLERHPETAAAIRREIDQLLVDELQDTDVVQCAIVRTIALAGPISERPGLFLVGDPKQSIYGWRSADLRAYDDFVADVLANGGVRHVLSVNYRSLPAILAEVSRAVAPTMQRVEGLQPAFQPLIPAPARASPNRHRSAPAVEYWVASPWDAEARLPARGGRTADISGLEARALASDLRRVHDEEGVAWNDVGVLFRSSSDLDLYLGALREAGVPYLVEGDRQYYERREVIDAVALLRTILEPHDQLALLTLLRSPLVGVPDAALLPLWLRGFPAAVAALSDASAAPAAAAQEIIAAAGADIPTTIEEVGCVRGWEQSLSRAVDSIATLRASFAGEPVDLFVERLRTMFLPEAIEASRRLGAYRLANLQRFFRQLLVALEQGDTDPQQLIRRMRTAIAERVDAEEERPSENVDDAVRVLTIHRAKGLDFAHVYVMQLHKEAGTSWGIPVDMATLGGQSEYRLFSGRTLRFWNVEARRAAVAAAEQVRTLYVAMTRAKSRLVLSGKWPLDRTPVDAERARSQLRLLLSRQPPAPDLEALMVAAAHQGRTAVDDGDVRWVFPALFLARATGAASFRVGVGDRAAVQAAHDRLEQLTADAARHSARPLVTPVSVAVADLLDEETASMLAGPHGTPRDARIARAAGIAVHAMLEAATAGDDPRGAFAQRAKRLHPLLQAHVDGDELDDALGAAQALLERFVANACGAMFRRIADRVVARELPVLIPPLTSAQGPVGCFTGAIDLLYRDPATSELVVADYKTDRVETDEEIAQHVAAYRAQGTHYVRAIHEALQLTKPPRFELWFLHPGRIEVVIS